MTPKRSERSACWKYRFFPAVQFICKRYTGNQSAGSALNVSFNTGNLSRKKAPGTALRRFGRRSGTGRSGRPNR